MDRNVICMTTDKGKKEAFVIVGDAQECIDKMKAGLAHHPTYISGYEVVGGWRDKLLEEYRDTMEDVCGEGHWEYPGIYIPANPKVQRFCKHCYLPDYILGSWHGDADCIPEM